MESGEGSSSLPSIDAQESNTIFITSRESNNGNDDDLGFKDVPDSNNKRKRTSDIWSHFKKLVIDGTIYRECNYCKSRLKIIASHGTNSLRKHYEKSYKRRQTQMDIRQSLMRTTKQSGGIQDLKAHIFNQKDSRRELAMMVILHDYPLSIVEHISFRRFVSNLQPYFHMMSINNMKNDIVTIYNDVRTKCSNLLDKLKYQIAITTDMWISNNTKKCFMAVHFIDNLWVLHNYILRFIYVPAPHTAEVLSDALVESLMDWNIDRKVSKITVDNCTTNDVMLCLLLDKLPRRYLLLNGKVLHMHCYAPILNLIVKESLEIINNAIEKIRDSIIYWTASPSRVEKFEDVVRQLNINCGIKLSLDCKTRWNSTYPMLETAIAYKDVFPRVKYRERNYKSLPTDEDWINAIEICGKLKTFFQVTEMFSGTLYSTSNLFFPKIRDIKLKLVEWEKSPNVIITCMAERIIEKYEKNWDNCHIMMGIAAVLDPRYKLILVEFYFPLIYGEKSSQSKIDVVHRNCYEMLDDYQSRTTTLKESKSISRDIGGTSSCVTSLNTSDVPLDMYDKFVATKSNSTSI